MSQVQIATAFVVNGQIFNSKQEAQDFLRKPLIQKAMSAVTGGNAELTEWLVENQETVEMAFETGSIRRVTKSDAKKLRDALTHIAEELKDDKKAAFIVDNIGVVADSFRWPSVKRMDDAEKATAARNTLVAASEGNEELAEWVIEHKDAVTEAYGAGKVKREVSEKAASGLAEYRARMAAEKTEMEAAEAKGPAAVEALLEARAKAKAAKEAAKAA